MKDRSIRKNDRYMYKKNDKQIHNNMVENIQIDYSIRYKIIILKIDVVVVERQID